MTSSSLAAPKTRQTTRRGLRPMLVVMLVISLYILLNASSIQNSLPAQAAFGLLIAVITSSIIIGLLHRRRIPHVGFALGFWGLIMVAQILQYPLSPNALSQHAFSDLAIMLVPIGLAVVIGMWAQSRDELMKLMIVVVASATVGAVIAWVTSSGLQRFESPSILAIVGSWVLATLPYSGLSISAGAARRLRVVALAVVIILLPVILASRSRTALGVWVLAGLVCFVLPGMRRRPRSIAMILAAIVCAVAFLTMADRLVANGLPAQLVAQARLEALISRSGDASSESRIAEVADVVSTMQVEGSALDTLLGFGHGASYLPNRSYIAPNVDAETGRVHHIHVTPAMVGFRYGAVGLLAFLVLFGAAFMNSLVCFRRRRDLLSAFVLVSLLMYFTDLLVRNSFVDPGMSLVIAVAFVGNQLKDSSVGAS